MLHYHTNATVSNEKILSIEKQEQRERSLSPDSLEQRLYKNQILFEDNDDEEEESILSSSPSLIDSINFDQLHSPQRYQNNSTKTILKTLTSHGFLNTISFLNNNDNEDDMDDIDEIHIDQDEVNLLFSDADDGIIRRLANEFLDIDDDYDETEDFSRHIRPLGLINSSHNQNHDQHLQQQQQQQYIPYHLLDPISEAASEEERRAAISLIRQQQDQQKHKHSTSSSLSLSANGHPDDDTTTNDDLSTLSDMDEQNTSMDENSISQTCSLDNEQHLHKKRRHRDHNSSIHWSTMIGTIDTSGGPDDTLERLRNITKMFSSKAKDEEEPQLKKVEKFEPGEKIKNTFKKFEEAGSSNGVQNDEEEEEEDQPDESDGIVRSRRKKKTQVDPLPYHEIAGVKDKFEKGLMDSDKPRGEKQLDVTVQSGSASAKKQAFEQNQVENESNLTKTVVVDRDALAGAATEQKAKFEKGEFDHDYHDFGSNRVQADANLLVGAASERKAKFESGQVSDRATTPTRRDEIASLVETGHAQAKRSEILSKIESEQQVLRSGDRHIDIDTEQGLASTRREQLASLAQTEFKSNDKHIDVTTGLASTIKEQYIADTNKASTTKMVPAVSVESGLTKSRTTAFENPDETQIKRTVEIDNEILDRHVAKDRVAMFKNLESGAQSTAAGGADSKIRVDRVEFSDTLVNMSVRLKIKSTDTDKNIVSNTSGEENGNVVRESDKREEIHFEKGQTKQLVEQWKTKQLSPDRDTPDAQILRDAEILQHGKAKNLVEMWKTMDKENSPPAERRGPRPITPPADNQRHLPTADDDESTPRKPSYSDDKANIESGHAKAVRERLMQTAEQANAVNTKKTIRQITPPPNDVRNRQLGTETETTDSSSITEQYENNEEIVPTKGQAQSLKNRFAEFEKDALKVETSSSKIKHTPKRFVDTPAPKPASVEPAVDPTKCSVCQKTVYAMEKIEADKKIYHKSCFKCMHCKSILKLGNYTANDGQIYCKPHFLQLFAIKGNYSAGFGLNDHKARWLPNSSSSASSSSPSSSISNTQESSSFNEN